MKPAAPQTPRRDERAVRKEISNVEKTIAKLDDQKKKSSAELLTTTDAKEAMRLHEEIESLTGQLAEAEDRWCQLQAELEE
jgi:ATP-binding cassette subfamily F protein 3